MGLTWLDGVAFLAFLGVVMAVSLYAGRKESGSEDYFLAGRRLTWWLIGFSLIASNISTEHFVGMAGTAYGRVGLAIASYEWMSAICLVLVAWFLLPRFLSAGIYTMPEYLEYRYSRGARTIMAAYLLVAYVIVLLATVLYSGAVALIAIFDIPAMFEARMGLSPADAERWAMIACIWLIGVIAGSYTVYGGLKAVVWSDLIQGAGLLLGGATVGLLGLRFIGDGSLIEGWRVFSTENADKLHTVLPWNDPDVPWLAVFIGGLWIPNLFYWGLNQFITQRTLAARNLAEGQKGILFAACMKLLIPFVIVFPGIMAFHLYGDIITDGDRAYPYMISRILPPQLRGIMFAALCGAVMSTFNSGLNSASTIFTIDLYAKYINPGMTPRAEVRVGRIATAVIVVIACLWAPVISNFEGVFHYIQEIWGFISPGIVAVFLVGLVLKRAPALAAKSALVLGVPLYGLCRIPKWCYDAWYARQFPDAAAIEAPEGVMGVVYAFNSWAFLHHMAVVFLLLAACMAVITKWRPLPAPVTMPRGTLDVTPDPRVYVMGIGVIIMTVCLYLYFW